MKELFPTPVHQERFSGYEEEATQSAYVQELAEHVETIPDMSALPDYHLPSAEEGRLLGKYCSGTFFSRNLEMEDGIVPLFRDDIIDPHFCRSVDELTRKITGSSPGTHWYREADREGGGYFVDSHQARFTSRRWEMAYVDYMRQRRAFHASFMNALLTKDSIAANIEAIGVKDDGSPIDMPSTDPYKGGRQSAPDFMYNRTNWVTASLLSALALPPEKCDVDMKRHAIEQWAQHADLNDPEGIKEFYGLEKMEGPVRLPWSMRSNAELQMASHPQWHQNRIIKEYLGEPWKPRADGLDALLQDRPKDYVQVLMLQTFDVYRPDKGLRGLEQAAALAPEIKDIIFAEDAAHNTIYARKALPEYGQPTTLLEFLNAADEGVTPQTQESIIEGQRLRIQVLTEELENAGGENERRARLVDELTAANNELAARVNQLEAILREQYSHLPKSQADLSMLEFGISPGISNEMLLVVVSAIRRNLSKKLHSDTGNGIEAEDELKEANNALDNILRSRGLGKNRG